MSLSTSLRFRIERARAPRTAGLRSALGSCCASGVSATSCASSVDEIVTFSFFASASSTSSDFARRSAVARQSARISSSVLRA